MAVDVLTLADRNLAYQRQSGDTERKVGVLFLSGYASDMAGSKASFLAARCAAHGVPFLRFDYRGCGQSSGRFEDGTIGAWAADALEVFDRLTTGPQIVIGSSMGAWIGLKLVQARSARIKALIGVAAAPDFTENLIWAALTEDERAQLMRDGILSNAEGRGPLTLRFLEEARQHLVLSAPLSVPCPLRLIHGMRDQDVPWGIATQLAAHVAQEDVTLTLIKNGDHRLSNPEDLEILWQTVESFLSSGAPN